MYQEVFMTTKIFGALLLMNALSAPAFADEVPTAELLVPNQGVLSCDEGQKLYCIGGQSLKCSCIPDPDYQPHPKPMCDAGNYNCPPPGEGFHHG